MPVAMTGVIFSRVLLRPISYLLTLSWTLTALPLSAPVVRLEVASRNDVLGGRSFGEAGAYERLKGKVYFSIAVPIVTTRASSIWVMP